MSVQSGLKPVSIEKCARVGVYRLMKDAEHHAKTYNIGPFAAQLKREFANIVRPKIAKWKIAVSIVLPLVPLVLLIISVVKSLLTKRVFGQLGQKIRQEPSEERAKGVKKLADQLLQHMEGVPGFINPQVPMRAAGWLHQTLPNANKLDR